MQAGMFCRREGNNGERSVGPLSAEAATPAFGVRLIPNLIIGIVKPAGAVIVPTVRANGSAHADNRLRGVNAMPPRSQAGLRLL